MIVSIDGPLRIAVRYFSVVLQKSVYNNWPFRLLRGVEIGNHILD